MSGGWSLYIIVLTVSNIAAALWLLFWQRKKRVEKHGHEDLFFAPLQVQTQEIAHRLRRGEQIGLAHLFGQRAAGQLQHGHQFGAFGRPQTLDAL